MIVAVIGTVIVAALVNGNDAVSVADAVVAPRRSSRQSRRSHKRAAV